MSAKFPEPLKAGDTIALVAPASVPGQESIDRFCEDWTSRGFQVNVAEHVFAANGYLAGTDEQRAADLMEAFADPEVAAIFAVRGGYGVNRMVGLLDFDLIRANPKIFAGFSDMTTLHGALNRHCGLVTFHAPHPNDGLDPSAGCEATSDSFLRCVTEPLVGMTLVDGRVGELTTEVAGRATGRLCGGNLAVLASTLGTEFCPVFDGCVLFLEDVGEPPYRVDRYLSQLKLAGALDQIAGVMLGHFTDGGVVDLSTSLSLERVFADYFGELGVPVLGGVPCGHALPNLTLALNARVELDADGKTVKVV